MTYRPNPLPSSDPSGSGDDLRSTLEEYLRLELENIAASFNSFSSIQFVKLTTEPAKPRDGLTVYADGTLWDPGSGEGVYTYYASSWHKLG